MTFPFEWNPYADQPHNVAPRSERLRHHISHAGSYLEIARRNLLCGPRILALFAKYRRGMFASPVVLDRPLGCAVSPAGGREEEILSLLAETGAGTTIVRIPSWERDRLGGYEAFVRSLHNRGFEVCLALLQRRADVLDPPGWRSFLEETFARFAPYASHFEVGHAWNRTKWGVWDHREYLALAAPAFDLAPRYGVRLIGPAVIDFEFHLYPVTLPRLPFEAWTSLLYVDRVGAPENTQFGWSAEAKLALLRACLDASSPAGRELWITEFNWPLAGTGPWSPASGRPNVGEEEQADYLVRYALLGLAGGMVRRIYWWQLAAPGYGLADPRERPARRRPSLHAFRTLASRLENSLYTGYTGRIGKRTPRAFFFRRGEEEFAAAWTPGPPAAFDFGRPIRRTIGRDGEEKPGAADGRVFLTGSPQYVIFE